MASGARLDGARFLARFRAAQSTLVDSFDSDPVPLPKDWESQASEIIARADSVVGGYLPACEDLGLVSWGEQSLIIGELDMARIWCDRPGAMVGGPGRDRMRRRSRSPMNYVAWPYANLAICNAPFVFIGTRAVSDLPDEVILAAADVMREWTGHLALLGPLHRRASVLSDRFARLSASDAVAERLVAACVTASYADAEALFWEAATRAELGAFPELGLPVARMSSSIVALADELAAAEALLERPMDPSAVEMLGGLVVLAAPLAHVQQAYEDVEVFTHGPRAAETAAEAVGEKSSGYGRAAIASVAAECTALVRSGHPRAARSLVAAWSEAVHAAHNASSRAIMNEVPDRDEDDGHELNPFDPEDLFPLLGRVGEAIVGQIRVAVTTPEAPSAKGRRRGKPRAKYTFEPWGLVGQPRLTEALQAIGAELSSGLAAASPAAAWPRLLLVGPDAVGQHRTAEAVAELLEMHGLGTGEVIRTHIAELAASDIPSAIEKVGQVMESAEGHVWLLDGLEDGLPKAAMTALARQLAAGSAEGPAMVLACSKADHARLVATAPDLTAQFRAVEMEPLSTESLVKIAGTMAAARGVRLSPRAKRAVTRQMDLAKPTGRLTGTRIVGAVLDAALANRARRLVADDHQRDLLAEDFADIEPVGGRIAADDQVFDELDDLIGLTDVKAEIQLITAEASMHRVRLDAGLALPSPARHLVFAGNPGTAKTTIARILARTYATTGVLRTGHLVEVGRADLVGEYVGHTAPKVQAVMNRARGGVLFIDEAYSLASGDSEKGGYGAEAIAELLRLMENFRDELVVIVAGYPNEMNQLLRSNPGFASRFARVIRFADYSDSQLAEIFTLQVSTAGMDLTDGALDAAMAHLRTLRARPNFGNARAARTLFERACALQAARLVNVKPSAKQLRTLVAADIPPVPAGEAPIGFAARL